MENTLVSLELTNKKVLNNLYTLLENQNLTEEQANIISSCIWEIEIVLFGKSNINIFLSCGEIGQEKN